MRQAITITQTALRDIAVHAREAWPDECCGLLIGTTAAIETAHRARNLHESPTRYLLHPEDHFAALRLARARSLQVVGAYHSHPAGRPVPSPTDRAEAHDGAFVHVIAGVQRLQRARGRRGRGSAARRARWPGERPDELGPPRVVQVLGQWLAAWRLVDGNFVAVPLVRLP